MYQGQSYYPTWLDSEKGYLSQSAMAYILCLRYPVAKA
jgi:hypothetical protein